jgi:hypothetical protein
VEPIKIVHSLAITYNDGAHIAPFRLANGATDMTVKALLYFADAGAQIERMSVKFFCRTQVGSETFTPADFQMFPATLACEADNAISYYINYLSVKNKRLAHIAEWETHSAPPGKRATYFHYRYKRGQSASAGKLKVKRMMVVSMMKHLCPTTGVKATGVVVQGNNKVPTGIVDGINNPHSQWFLGRVRFYRGILDRKRRRLH